MNSTTNLTPVVDSNGAAICAGATLDVHCMIDGQAVTEAVTVDALIPDRRRGASLVWLRVVPDDVDQAPYAIRWSRASGAGVPRLRVNRAAAGHDDAFVTVRSTTAPRSNAA